MSRTDALPGLPDCVDPEYAGQSWAAGLTTPAAIADPVVAIESAQTSLDPFELRAWIPNAIYGGHAFGFAGRDRTRSQEFELLISNRQRVLPWIRDFSPIELVSSEDPPIYLEFPKQQAQPVLGQNEPDPTHSALYGVKLKQRLEGVGVEAVLSYPGHQDTKYGTRTKFLVVKLTGE